MDGTEGKNMRIPYLPDMQVICTVTINEISLFEVFLKDYTADNFPWSYNPRSAIISKLHFLKVELLKATLKINKTETLTDFKIQKKLHPETVEPKGK